MVSFDAVTSPATSSILFKYLSHAMETRVQKSLSVLIFA